MFMPPIVKPLDIWWLPVVVAAGVEEVLAGALLEPLRMKASDAARAATNRMTAPAMMAKGLRMCPFVGSTSGNIDDGEQAAGAFAVVGEVVADVAVE